MYQYWIASIFFLVIFNIVEYFIELLLKKQMIQMNVGTILLLIIVIATKYYGFNIYDIDIVPLLFVILYYLTKVLSNQINKSQAKFNNDIIYNTK